MKTIIKDVITLTIIGLICSTLIYVTYMLVGGIS